MKKIYLFTSGTIASLLNAGITLVRLAQRTFNSASLVYCAALSGKLLCSAKAIAIAMVLLLFFSSSNLLLGQTSGDYRSNGNGNWGTAGTWQTYNGTTWITATTAPNSSNGVITIISPNTITVLASVTVDQVVINSGGTVAFSTNENLFTMTIANGTGNDLINNGILTVNGKNGSQRGILLINGQLQHNNITANSFQVGTNGTVTVANGGTVMFPGETYLSGAGLFNLNSGATIEIGSTAGVTTSGATGNVQVTGTRAYSSGANYVYNGTASQVTGNGLTINTPANLTINNSSGVTLSAVTPISGLLTMTSGTLNMASTNLTVGSLTGSSNITATSGTRVLTIGSDNTSPAAYSGVISNGTATSVAVTKTGTGTLALHGLNTFSGAVTINTGILNANTLYNSGLSSSIGTGNTVQGITVGGTGILQYTGTGHSTSRPIVLSGSGATIDASGTGTMTLDGGITGNTYSLVLTGIGTGVESQAIVITSGTVAKNGSGTWVLSGANTYTGVTSINSGMLRLGSGGDATNTPLGTVAAGTTVYSGGVLDLNGYELGTSESLTLNGSGISQGGALTNSAATAVAYKGLITLGSTSSIIANAGDINLTNTSIITGAGSGLTLGGSGNGSVSSIIGTTTGTVTKSGTGTWTLSGISTYTGATTIGGGTLRLGVASNASGNGPLGSPGTGTYVTDGGSLDLYDNSQEEPLFLNGNGYLNEGALKNSLVSVGDPLLYNGSVELQTSGRIGTTGDIKLSSTINAADKELSKVGIGTLTLGSGLTWLNALSIIQGPLTIPPEGQVTVTTLTNSGTLNILSSPVLIGSLKVDTYSDQGTNNIQLFLPGAGEDNFWHYISSPVDNLSTDDIAAGNDLAQFVESLPVIDNGETDPPTWQRGWIAWDGWSYLYDYDNEPIDPYEYGNTYSFSSLARGKGYNYWNSSDYTFTFTGQIFTSDLDASITFSDDPIWSGYNLLGNPYTCGIDIQAMFDNAGWTSALKSVWFTIDGSTAVFSDGYLSVPGGSDGTIPPMAGFFVKATDDGIIPFLLTARAHSATLRYKGPKALLPIIRLSVSENGKSEETVVRFDEKATPEIDMNFDAPRFMPSSNTPSIFTSVDNVDYTINGLPFPETSVEIPVTVKLLTDGNHSITAMEVKELKDYKVTLTDKISKSTVDLKTVKEYKFSGSAGLIKDRFILTISSISTGTEEPVNEGSIFNIYQGFDLINIQPLSDEWDGKTGSIKVMDLSGKAVRLQQKTEFRKNTLIQLASPETNGLYFIEIRSGLMKHIGKVFVK